MNGLAKSVGVGRRAGWSCALVLVVLGFFGAARPARAQGSRKDDIVFNAQGRPMAGATVRVCTATATGQPCSPLAAVYSDAAMTQALANPLATDGLGNYTFYASPGRYEMEFSGPGITTKQIPNVILPSDPSSPTFTTVTTTSGISAFSLSLTGNLTVAGSTAVLGTLTVGGIPVPSTTADNQWQTNQRFGGAIPYRDFTSFMPAGGCSFANSTFPYGYTGSIGSGSKALTVSSAADFKNGCGITVEHAGPTSTLVTPSCTVASAVRTSNVVTITCAANSNLVWTGSGGANGQDQGASISGCSDSTFNGVWVMQSNDATTHFTYNSTGSNATPSGCTVRFLLGWPHGVAGSSTYYYKIAAVDSGGGMSAAIGPLTITTGNATLSTSNYNAIFWPFIVSSKGTAIYRSLDNVTYTCVGMQMAGIAYQDWGYTGPCPDYVPAAPPASPTAQALTTMIASGAGSTSLVLAANAANTVSSQAVFHDEMPFLDACVNAVNADQRNLFGYSQGSAGCYIPAGVYHFNSDWSTDRIGVIGGGIQIRVSGALYMGEWPMIVGKSNYSVIGEGYSGGGTNASNYPTIATARAVEQPGVFVIKAPSVWLEGFSTSAGNGHALYIGLAPDGQGAAAGIKVKRMILGESSTAAGVPVVLGGNTFNVEFEDVNLTPRPDGFPASVLMTTDSFFGIGGADLEFNHMQFIWHHFFTNAPEGQSGQGFGFGVNTMWSEEHGQYPTGGFITQDTGGAAIPTSIGILPNARLAGIVVRNMQNADAGNKTFLEVLGNNAGGGSFVLNSADSFNPMVQCPTVSGAASSCSNGTVSTFMISDTAQNLLGLLKGYVGPVGPGYMIGAPLTVTSGYGDWGNTPPSPAFADALPAPYTVSVTGTGAGSLAAGTYCMRIVGLDTQGTAGQTLPSPEVCQTVGASSSISLSFQLALTSGYPYSNYQLWWGSSAGAENQYILTGIAPAGPSTISYVFTSTAGAAGGALPTMPTAYLSWLYRDIGKPGCLYCLAGNSAAWQLGVGEPSVPSGDKLAVKGGVLDAESGFKAALSTKSSAYTLTTFDSWVNVSGTTTITVPHATAGNRWVVFNSGAGTVTVPADSGNINGGASISVAANTGKEIVCDGSNCFAH